MNGSNGVTARAAELVGDARVVIFDCDDTVIATARKRWKVLIATALSFDVVLTEDTIVQAWGTPFDHLIHTIVPTIDYEEFVARYRVAMRATRPETTEGAAELLAHLAATATRMEIVTSSSRELITQDLDDLCLTGYFARIYGYEETTFHKPDPRVFDIVIANLMRHGFGLHELIYIGDSVRDYLAAAGSSVEFVAVLSGIDSIADFMQAGLATDRVVVDLSQLIHRADANSRLE